MKGWFESCLAALCVGALVAISGCGSAAAPAQLELRVFAAASLSDAFAQLERAYEQAHPAVDVKLNLAGSQVLRLQIEQGAPADIFVSANGEHLDALIEGGMVRRHEAFARNAIVLAVPLGNPAQIEKIEDLPRARRLVIAQASVPAGAYARELLRQGNARLGPDFSDRVMQGVVSQETNVRLVRAKLELGEADAGFVYRSDLTHAAELREVPLPPELGVHAQYPIAQLERATNAAEARRFMAFLRTPLARDLVDAQGFEAARP